MRGQFYDANVVERILLFLIIENFASKLREKKGSRFPLDQNIFNTRNTSTVKLN